MLKQLIEYVVFKFVANKDHVSITETVSDDTIILKLQVAPEDLGKVIGKDGKTARYIRSLISAAAFKEGKKAILEIVK